MRAKGESATGPDISINICTHSSLEFIRTCLHSIRRELRQISFEVNVVDNGSTDGTVAMLEI